MHHCMPGAQIASQCVLSQAAQLRQAALYEVTRYYQLPSNTLTSYCLLLWGGHVAIASHAVAVAAKTRRCGCLVSTAANTNCCIIFCKTIAVACASRLGHVCVSSSCC